MDTSETITAQNCDSDTRDINVTRTQKVKSFLLKKFAFTLTPNLTWRERITKFLVNRYKNTSWKLKALFVWSLFEIILCYSVLHLKTENYVENFIAFIGGRDFFAHYLENALYVRIILSIISITGILMVRPFF